MAGPGGKPVGSVTIKVVPDTRRFGPELRAQLQKLERSLELAAPVTADTSKAKVRLERFIRDAEREDIDLGVNTKKTDQALSGVKKKLDDIVSFDVNNLLSGVTGQIQDINTRQIKLPDMDISKVERSIGRVKDSLYDIETRQIKLPELNTVQIKKSLNGVTGAISDLSTRRIVLPEMDISGVLRPMRRLSGSIYRIDTRKLDWSNELDKTRASLRRVTDGFNRAATTSETYYKTKDRANQTLATTKKRLDGLLSPLVKANVLFSKIVGYSVGLGGLVGVLGVLVASVVQLGDELGQAAVGLAAFGPAALTALAATAGTVALGLNGMSDAMKDVAKGDAKSLEKSLRGLAPSAQDFVRSVNKVKPAFDKMRLKIQQRLFLGLGQQVQALSNKYLPVLQKMFTGIAGSLNKAAKSTGRYLISAQGTSTVTELTKNLRRGVDTIAPAMKPAVQAFLRLATTGSRFLPYLGRKITQVAEKFAAFLEAKEKSGELQQFFENTIRTVVRLFGVLRSVAQGFGNIKTAANQAMGGALGNLEDLATSFQAFTGSVEGQKTLVTFFKSAKRVTESLIKPFKTLVKVVGKVVAPVIADMAEKLGPGLTTVISGLGRAIAIASPAFVDLASVIGDGLENSGPLTELLGELAGIIAGALANAIRLLTPLMDTMVELFTLLKPVLEPILTPLLAIALAAGGARLAFGLLGKILAPTRGSLTLLRAVLGFLFFPLAHLGMLLRALRGRFGILSKFAGSTVVPALTRVRRAVLAIGTGIGGLVTRVATSVPALGKSFQLWAKNAWASAKSSNGAFGRIRTGAGKTRTAVSDAFRGMGRFTLRTGSLMLDGFKLIAAGIVAAAVKMRKGIIKAIHAVAAVIKRNPWGFLLTLVASLIVWIITHFNDFKRYFKNFVNWVKYVGRGLFDGIAGAARGFVNGIIGFLNMCIGAINSILRGINNVTSAVGIPGIPMIPKIPMLAEGGTITSAGNVIVGEEGPEMLTLPKGASVTPLDKGGSSGSVSSGGPDISMADAIREAVFEALNGARFTVDGDGMAKLVNRVNNRNARR